MNSSDSDTQRFSNTQRLSITQRLSVLRPDSIRNKILMFAILATLLPSFTTAWISYFENKQSLVAKASEELLSASTQAARELDLWTKERRYDLRVFASSYEITENVELIARSGDKVQRSGRAWQRVTDYLNSVRGRFVDFEELAVVDPAGRVLASSGVPGKSVPLPEGWQSEMRNDHLVLSAPYWNTAQKRPEMIVAVPIGTAQGRFIGAIAARVNLRAVAATIRRFQPGEAGAVYLLRSDGSVIVGSGENSAALMQLHYPRAEIETRVKAARPVEYGSLLGQDVIGSTREVPALAWLVVAEIPSLEVFQQLAHLRNVTLLVVAGMLAVAGILGYALGLFIVRPLDILTRGAAKVAAGDFDVDLPVASGGEAAYLTEVFNWMVARLRAGRRELERLSVTDPLTGLNNRRRMMEALDNEVRRSRRLAHTFAVLMADVDHFKQYNDAHGHPAGDEVLQRVAAVLRETTRDVDFVARYGGEEFFVVLPEFEMRHALELADKIRQRLAREEFAEGHVTMSFGLAEFPAHGDTGDELIAVADEALYQAKRKGRDQVVAGGSADRAKAAG